MIVVGGEALVDLVIARNGAVTATLGGGPFNTARAVARLGSGVCFYGCLSGDRFGVLLDRQLRADGVAGDLVQYTDLPTTLASAELDEHGSAQYRFYTTETSAPSLHPVELPPDTTAVHVGSLGLVLEPLASTLESVVASSEASVLVMLDPNCRPAATRDRNAYLDRLQRLIRRADVVKVSREDLDFIGTDGWATGLRWLQDRGATLVVHTDGARGVTIHHDLEEIPVPVPIVDVADTIGAGDAFGGGFLAWWDQAGLTREHVDDLDLVRAAVAAAVDVAAVNCARVGAEPPMRAELGERWRPARR
jgi:fructokinase